MNYPWIWLGFAVAFGAVFGSFINVIVYRLPQGISLLNPRFSFCPKCHHSIAWWENIPVLAWFYLRGKCSACRQPISPIYPIIEGLTAALFGLVFWGLYISPFRQSDFGAPGGGLPATWPVLLVYLALLVGMIAATVIDARLYIIPLQIPWMVTAIAVILLPVGVFLVPLAGPFLAHHVARNHAFYPNNAIQYYLAVAPQALDIWLGAALGGGIGWLLALVLLQMRIIPQSFADEEAAHDAVAQHPHLHVDGAGGEAADSPVGGTREQARSTGDPLPDAVPPPEGVPPESVPPESVPPESVPPESAPPESVPPVGVPPEDLTSKGPTADGLTPPSPALEGSASERREFPKIPESLKTPEVPVALEEKGDAKPQEASHDPPLSGPAPAADSGVPDHADFVSPVPQNPEELEAWLSHPHMDREIAKECIFVALPLIGFVAGALIYYRLNPLPPTMIGGAQFHSFGLVDRMIYPLHLAFNSRWLDVRQVLGGVVSGYLVGGGLIWITRIIGTFAFRKEAMGLGDIHLLAAIGAVMGPTDAVLVFFIAPFLGLAYAGCVISLNRLIKGQIRIIPYGPYLAIAAVLVMIFERGIWMMLRQW